MLFFLVLGLLFLAGAIYNLFTGNFTEMAGGLLFTAVFLAIYFARRRKVEKDIATIAATGS
jgi:hypothetical protein